MERDDPGLFPDQGQGRAFRAGDLAAALSAGKPRRCPVAVQLGNQLAVVPALWRSPRQDSARPLRGRRRRLVRQVQRGREAGGRPLDPKRVPRGPCRSVGGQLSGS